MPVVKTNITSAHQTLPSVCLYGRQRQEAFKSVVYPAFSDETFVEYLINRHDRPHKVIKPYVEQELRANNLLAPNETLSWSKNAGCSMCPCSPGWLVMKKNSEGKTVRQGKGLTVWCDVKVVNELS